MVNHAIKEVIFNRSSRYREVELKVSIKLDWLFSERDFLELN